MSKKVHVSLTVLPETKTKIEKIARDCSMSVSDIMKIAIKRLFARKLTKKEKQNDEL